MNTEQKCIFGIVGVVILGITLMVFSFNQRSDYKACIGLVEDKVFTCMDKVTRFETENLRIQRERNVECLDKLDSLLLTCERKIKHG